MSRILLMFVVGVCFSGSLCAQTSSDAEFRDIKQAWRGRFIGGNQPDGSPLEGHAVCRHVSGDRAVIVDIYTPKFTGTWMIAHDSAAKKIRTFYTSSTGEFGHGVMYKEDDAWVVEGKGTSEKGQAETYVNRVTITMGGDRHQWGFTSTSHGETSTFTSIWDRAEP